MSLRRQVRFRRQTRRFPVDSFWMKSKRGPLPECLWIFAECFLSLTKPRKKFLNVWLLVCVLLGSNSLALPSLRASEEPKVDVQPAPISRSEERRVGKEGRVRCGRSH